MFDESTLFNQVDHGRADDFGIPSSQVSDLKGIQRFGDSKPIKFAWILDPARKNTKKQHNPNQQGAIQSKKCGPRQICQRVFEQPRHTPSPLEDLRAIPL
jgi:hypothetical protein